MNRYLIPVLLLLLFTTVSCSGGAPATALPAVAGPVSYPPFLALKQQSLLNEPIVVSNEYQFRWRNWVIDSNFSLYDVLPNGTTIEWEHLGKTVISKDNFYVCRSLGIFKKMYADKAVYALEKAYAQTLIQYNSQAFAFDDAALTIYTADAGFPLEHYVRTAGATSAQTATDMYAYESLMLRIAAANEPIGRDIHAGNWMKNSSGVFSVVDLENVVLPNDPAYPKDLIGFAAATRTDLKITWSKLQQVYPGLYATYEEALLASGIDPNLESLVKTVDPTATIPNDLIVVRDGELFFRVPLAPDTIANQSVDDLLLLTMAKQTDKAVTLTQTMRFNNAISIAYVVFEAKANTILQMDIGEAPFAPRADTEASQYMPSDTVDTLRSLLHANYGYWVPFQIYQLPPAAYYWDAMLKRHSMNRPECLPLVLQDPQVPNLGINLAVTNHLFIGTVCPDVPPGQTITPSVPSRMIIRLESGQMGAYIFNADGANTWSVDPLLPHMLTVDIPVPNAQDPIPVTCTGTLNLSSGDFRTTC